MKRLNTWLNLFWTSTVFTSAVACAIFLFAAQSSYVPQTSTTLHRAPEKSIGYRVASQRAHRLQMY